MIGPPPKEHLMNDIIINKSNKFETFEDFVAQAKVPIPYKFSVSHRDNKDRNPWDGTNTFTEALDLANNGWPEGTNKVLAMRAKIDHIIKDLTNARSAAYVYDISGEFVDVGRYLTGEPECFVKEDGYGNINKPIVKIIVNVGASSSMSCETLIARGVSVVAAIDILEALGRRVEAWIGKNTRCGNIRHELLVNVKHANQPLDIDRLTFAAAHPACLRRLCFSILEQNKMNTSNCHSQEIKDDDAIVTDHLYRPYNLSTEELLKAVAGMCAKAGVIISESEIKSLSK